MIHPVACLRHPFHDTGMVYPVPFSQPDCLARCFQRPGDRTIPLPQRLPDHPDLVEFFNRKRQTLFQTLIHGRFAFQRKRNMQQRTA